MFKLSKKVEYGLIAVKHMVVKGTQFPCSAKEIADSYKISYDLLSKILQKLKHEEILTSIQGIKGGYKLNKRPAEISLASIFNAIEGDMYILDCGTHDDPASCKIYDSCILNGPLQKIQRSINGYFNRTMISEIV